MAVQQFCLRWNNHQPNFISVFTDLLNNETLVDVTLAAEGKQLQAHKVVLSACSTYFQALFTSTPCQHPIVILKDIKYNDLKTMVDFMYYGEVNVSQDQLPAILKTAETLKVKGLAEMPEGVSLSKSDSQGSESPWSLRRKRLRKSSTGSSEQTSTEDGAAGSVGSGGTLATPSPLVKQEIESEHHHPPPPTRDPSTESETARSHSFDTDDQTPATPSRNLSEEQSDTSNIKWSSSEEQKPSLIQQLPVIESGSAMSMGSKRGRLLMRQHRIKKENELGCTVEEEEREQGANERTCTPRIERHCSEPSPHHLTVPHYLPKQNSSPQMTVPSQPHHSQQVGYRDFDNQHLPAPPQVHVTPPTPTSPPPPEPTRSRSLHDDQRRHSTTQQMCGVIESCEGSRACHCPALRPGPALGCNFCWNTIDTHGRILRRKTKYHCPDCQTNLCIVPCFQEYHERQNAIGSGGGPNSGGGPPGSGSVGPPGGHSTPTGHSHSSSSHSSSSGSHGPLQGIHGPSNIHGTSSGHGLSSGSHLPSSNIHTSSSSSHGSSIPGHNTSPGGNSAHIATNTSMISHGHSLPSCPPSSKDSSGSNTLTPVGYPTIVKTYTL